MALSVPPEAKWPRVADDRWDSRKDSRKDSEKTWPQTHGKMTAQNGPLASRPGRHIAEGSFSMTLCRPR